MTETVSKHRSENSANELGSRSRFITSKTWTALYLLLIALSISHIVVTLHTLGTPLNSSGPVYLDIDPASELSSDVASIEHDKNDATVTVRFRAGASCPRPFLMGRLSGPALSLIQDWKWQIDDEMTTSLTGSYHVPFPGIYYIEIIAIYCADFSDVDGMDFTKTCVIDPLRNRLSIQSANITVSQMGSNQGYWIANNTTISSTQISSTKTPIMYTRFQTPECRQSLSLDQESLTLDQESRCGIATSLERYMDYHFEYLPSSPMSHVSLADLVQKNLKTICVIGDSHAKRIFGSMPIIGIRKALILVEVLFLYARYPNDVTLDRITSFIETAKCNILLIAVGQWPASYDGRRPTLIGDYQDQIKAMIHNLTLGLSHSHPDVQIFMRSLHYNPLNERTTSCPPHDWRTPTVIDAYNEVIVKVCEKLENVTFIDTNFIVGPLWDSGPDWNHLSPELQSVESFYLAAVVLGIVEHSQSSSKY